MLERLRDVVDQGASQPRAPRELAPLSAELAVDGAVAIVHSRLREDDRSDGNLISLVNPLMWTIVLPYQGGVAAARELHRDVLSRSARRV